MPATYPPPGPLVVARDRTRTGRPLVYLEPGGADTLRDRVNAGELICPLDGCPTPQLTIVGGTSGRRHHFRHRATATLHTRAARRRLDLLTAVTDLLDRRGLQPAAPADDGDLHIDTGAGPAVVLLEDGPCGPATWWRRHRRLVDADLRPVWLFDLSGWLWLELFGQVEADATLAAVVNTGLTPTFVSFEPDGRLRWLTARPTLRAGPGTLIALDDRDPDGPVLP